MRTTRCIFSLHTKKLLQFWWDWSYYFGWFYKTMYRYRTIRLLFDRISSCTYGNLYTDFSWILDVVAGKTISKKPENILFVEDRTDLLTHPIFFLPRNWYIHRVGYTWIVFRKTWPSGIFLFFQMSCSNLLFF